MGSFGNAGTRTKRTSRTLVKVNLKVDASKNLPEHLHYFIDAKGSTPIFNLSCQHRTLWSEEDFGKPSAHYKRVWPVKSEESDAEEEVYSVTFSFEAATDYTLRVERHDKKHNNLGTVKDVDYHSEDSTDNFSEGFRVKVSK